MGLVLETRRERVGWRLDVLMGLVVGVSLALLGAYLVEYYGVPFWVSAILFIVGFIGGVFRRSVGKALLAITSVVGLVFYYPFWTSRIPIIPPFVFVITPYTNAMMDALLLSIAVLTAIMLAVVAELHIGDRSDIAIPFASLFYSVVNPAIGLSYIFLADARNFMYVMLATAPLITIASAQSIILNLSPPAAAPGAIWGSIYGIVESVVVISLMYLSLYLWYSDRSSKFTILTWSSIASAILSGVVPLAFSTANWYVEGALPLFAYLIYDSAVRRKEMTKAGITQAQVETLEGVVNLFVEKVAESELLNELNAAKGYDELINWARETARDIVMAEKMKLDLGRGVLLYGPPGTGKSMLAYIVAYYILEERKKQGLEVGEVIRLTPRILSKYYGEAEQFVHALFDYASKKHAIIVADEVERYIWRRAMFVSDDITPKVVATFLESLDNPKVRAAPFVFIATTNSPLLADEAFLRPGRFFKVLEVKVPDPYIIRQIIAGFEGAFNVRLRDEERTELMRLEGLTGDDIRYYFTCRAIGRDHKYCVNDVKRLLEMRAKVKGMAQHQEEQRLLVY